MLVAVTALIVEQRERRRTRDEDAYNRVDDDYLRFLDVCMAHPSARVFEPEHGVRTTPLSHEERLVFEFLVNILERAFVLYRVDLPERRATPFRRRQWKGWDIWAQRWAHDARFRAAYLDDNDHGPEYDTQFQRYLASLIESGARDADL